MSEAGERPGSELSREDIRAAEHLLRSRFGGRPRIASLEAISGDAWVVRCALTGAPVETAILKRPKRTAGGSFDRSDFTPYGPAWRFTNEWAGLAFLDRIQGEDGPRLAPRFFGADPEAGMLLLEDLGQGVSLADLLLGAEPGPAERAFVEFGRSLGRMHALSAGLQDGYFELLESMGRKGERRAWTDRIRSHIERLPQTFEELEFEWSPGLVDDVQQIAKSMMEPGAFYAYAHGDPCPDNDRIIDGRVVFFDFDGGDFRHALLDGSYGRVPFPTCWCVNRPPEWLVEKFEAAYRLELMKGVPGVEDDAVFESALIEAAGFWLIQTANSLLPRALRLDQRWGISSYRQRLLYRFEVFTQTAARFQRLEALGAWAYLMRERLRVRWPEVRDMPLYPAFRP